MVQWSATRRAAVAVALFVGGHALAWWAGKILVENLVARAVIGLNEFSLADQLTQRAIGYASIVVPFALAVLILLALGIRPRWNFDYRRLPHALIGFALIATPAALLLGTASGLGLWEMPSLTPFGGAASAWISLILFTTITGVLVEELIFRGVLLIAIRDATGSRVFTIVATSALFALFHSQWDWASLAARFLLGGSLAWAAYQIGGVEFGAGVHLAINLTYLFLDPSFGADRVLVPHETVLARHTIDASLNQIQGAALYGIIILVGSAVLTKMRPKDNRKHLTT